MMMQRMFFFGLFVMRTVPSSIGSESESLLTCSKFHFEEKVLEKLVRLEHKVEIYEETVKRWENVFVSKLEKLDKVQKQSETFFKSMQAAQVQEEIRLNKSYSDVIDTFKSQMNNQTIESKFAEENVKIKTLEDKFAEKSVNIRTLESKFAQESVKIKTLEDKFEEFGAKTKNLERQVADNNCYRKGYDEMIKQGKTVAFSAYRSSEQNLFDRTKVLFNQVWTNVGNGYQPSTGIFTAPHEGLYHFTAVVMSTSGNNLYLKIYHNKVATSGSTAIGDGYKTGSFDVVLYLQIGDEVYLASGGTYTIYSNSNKFVTFSGHSIF